MGEKEMKLHPIKTTFRMNGSSHKKLDDLQDYIKNNHNRYITKTELINISIKLCQIFK